VKSLREAYRKGFQLIEPTARRRWIALGVLSLVVSVFELLGALLILVLFQIAQQPSGTISLPVVGDMGGLLSGLSPNQRVAYAGVAVALFFIVRGVVNVFQLYLQFRMASQSAMAVAARLLRGYLAMPFALHLKDNSARLIRNINESTEALSRNVLVSLIALVSDTAVVLAMVVLLVVAAPVITLVAAAVLGGTVMLMLRIIQPRLARLGRITQDEIRAGLQSLNQSFNGIRDVKLYGREESFGADFLDHRREFVRANYMTNTLAGIPRVGTETVFVLFIVGSLLVTQLSGGSAAAKFPVLGLFAYSALRILPAVNRMLLSVTSLKSGAAALDIVHDDLAMLAASSQPSEDVLDPVVLNSRIVLQDVGYRYDDAGPDVLTGISLVVAKGTSVGLVGPSGGGKSTLVDLLVGLLEPTSGAITVDGVDTGRNIRGWQATLGMVPQTVFLTDDSLRRNIAFGVPDTEIDDDAVRAAVTMAQLDEFVAALPAGLETSVAEAGVRLSGGQRQRVVIARALYRNPAVLVLDEGTSALDNLTEAQIIETLNRLKGRFTVIAVAHRLSSVRDCDQIVLVENGRISQVGTYDELTRTSGEFRRMAR
jgi:ATP-binding cassette subfamily C protein